MAFVEAKCPACGGAIQLDDAKESGFCMYCGTKVLLSESIPQKVKVEGIQTLDQKLKNAETYAKLGEIDRAIFLLTQITEEYTSDYRAWWILAKLKYAFDFFYENKDAGLENKIESSKEYKYFRILLDGKEDKRIENEVDRYVSQLSANIRNSQSKIEETLNGNLTYIKHAYQDNKGYEVIKGELNSWKWVSVEQEYILMLSKIDVKDLSISSIHGGIITFMNGETFNMSEHVSESYMRCYHAYVNQEKEQKKKTGWLIAGLCVFLLLIVWIAIEH